MGSSVHVVVLAGGSGTRFWPASRRQRPKQLLAIAPGSDEPLIAATVRRLGPIADSVTIATAAALVGATRSALPGLPESAFLGEPTARNTAPCIAWATARIALDDPDAVVAVVPSDQHIGDEPAYRAAVLEACASAATAITTIGLRPTRPETGYGYIEVGEPLGGSTHRAVRFVEKPTRPKAEEYVASGRFLWNGGMFFYRAAELMAALDEHAPDLAAGGRRCAAARSPEELAREFGAMRSISIDHAVMERLACFQVVTADCGWSDLGSWETSWELAPKDESGNAGDEAARFLDAERCLVRDLRAGAADRRVVALLGVSDLCVIQTDDAVLVLPRDRTQDVRKIVEALEREGRRDLL